MVSTHIDYDTGEQPLLLISSTICLIEFILIAFYSLGFVIILVLYSVGFVLLFRLLARWSITFKKGMTRLIEVLEKLPVIIGF